MGYSIRFLDITEFKGDAIVNSLGVQGNVYGQLCKSIMNGINDNFIKSNIDSLKNNKIGKIIITDAGALPCKKVIHIVTPLKHLDDEKNSLLIQAYKDIIDTAIKQGFQSIGLPFIGTGANGYSEDEVYEIMNKICDELSIQEEKEERNILEICIIGYLKAKKKKHIEGFSWEEYESLNRKIAPNEICSSVDSCLSKKFDKISRIRRSNFIKCSNAMFNFDYYNMITPKSNYKEYPFYFVLDYLEFKGLKDIYLNKRGMDRRRKHKFKERIKLEKFEIYAFAWLAEMDFSTLIQFMIACGYSFQPDNSLDLLMIDYYSGRHAKCETRYAFVQLCYDECDIYIFEGITNEGGIK